MGETSKGGVEQLLEETRSNPGCLLWSLGVALLLGLIAALLWWWSPFGGGSGSQQPTPTDAAPEATAMTVNVAGTAGGLGLRFTADDLVPILREAVDETGVDARHLVAGYYDTGSDSQVIFQGGELTDPLPEPELGESAVSTLDDLYRASFPYLQPPVGEGRAYDAGPLGGYVWCRAYQAGDPLEDYHVCGWIDEWTFGYTYSSGTTEADAAAQLVAMRTDLEVPRP